MNGTLPVIDLNLVSDEKDLLPVVRNILIHNDTFLLKNFANKVQLDQLVEELHYNDIPEVSQGFDANFTGCFCMEESLLLEQYINATDSNLHFDREISGAILKKLYNRLFKIAQFFGQLCLKSVTEFDNAIDLEQSHATKLTRYYVANQQQRQDGLVDLPTGDQFEYLFNRDYFTIKSAGLLTLFPVAKGIRYKPMTTSTDDNIWVTINEPDCLLVHTGQLLAHWSNGMHTTSPLSIDRHQGIVYLTIYPDLSLPWTPHDDSKSIINHLLKQQIDELPQIAEQYYSNELNQQKLSARIKFYKELFTVSETVLSLYAISRSGTIAPQLRNILPQLTNMMKRNISEDDFLKMVAIWPESYVMEANSKGELTIKLPKTDVLHTLTTGSRKLDFVKFAEHWFAEHSVGPDIPADVPILKISKRRNSSNETSIDNDEPRLNGKMAATTRKRPVAKSKYLSNSKEQYMYKEKKQDLQSNLLERLRERERKSAILLSQQQKKYQQFLTVKMQQVFNILFSLEWNKPHTITHLSALVVDSLQDSNNPIGMQEANEILIKLQNLLPSQISVHTVDGGLKVFKWIGLDKDYFEQQLALEIENLNNS